MLVVNSSAEQLPVGFAVISIPSPELLDLNRDTTDPYL